MTRRYYTVEFKTRVCEDYLNSDMTYEELSGKYEVNPSTLAKWVGIYREYGVFMLS
jgi:transposase-like protein